MKQNLKIKKNQHYVPKSYLRRFTIEGERSLLWEYNKEDSCFKRNTSSVNKVCSEDYYYYQQDEQGGIDHIQFEDSLSEVEKIGNDILVKIINSHAMPYSCITEKERGQLSFYIALMLTRGPGFRDCINNMHGEIVWSTFQQMYSSRELPKMPKKLQEKVNSNGLEAVIKAEIFSSVSLEYMVEAARDISLSFLEKNWIINFSSGEDRFITSDTPVIFSSNTGLQHGIGPAHPNTKITFPISSKIAITIEGARTPEDLKTRFWNSKEILNTNKLIANAANKSIFCSEKFSWLESITTNNGGQKLMSNLTGVGYEIIQNPYATGKPTNKSR